jgi:predicted DNA-binding antitoxin AbrB/MazE fold protein
MIHNVDAIYDQGVFRPVVPVGLPDGTPVHLRVEEDNGKLAESSERTTSYSVWLDRLAGR